jgi:hypothetical protein
MEGFYCDGNPGRRSLRELARDYFLSPLRGLKRVGEGLVQGWLLLAAIQASEETAKAVGEWFIRAEHPAKAGC